MVFCGGGGGGVLVCGARELRWTSLQHGVEDIGVEVGRTELSTMR
jgi:hypothetical protein